MASVCSSVIASSSVVYAFGQSDAFGRVIVLALLLISIFSWSVMVEKGLIVRRSRRGSQRFLRRFKDSPAPLSLALYLEDHSGPVPRIFSSAIEELSRILGTPVEVMDDYLRQGILPRQLDAQEMGRLRNRLEHATDMELLELEGRLGGLGTVVTVSPFLGLLGTVYGVMAAFCAMAQQGRPDIAAMAPGVSGALLTTVVGLLVAIPAVVGLNTLTNGVRRTTMEMDRFVEELLAEIPSDGRRTQGPDAPGPAGRS